MTNVKETAERISTEAIEVADALDEFAMIDGAEGGNPFVIATERRAAELLRILASRHADAQEGGEVEPVAWQHVFERTDGYKESEVNSCPEHPFGRAGRDYPNDAVITSTPLYAAPSNPVVSDEMVERVLCATEGCGGVATERFESAGVGSIYCPSCVAKIAALSVKPQSDGGPQ